MVAPPVVVVTPPVVVVTPPVVVVAPPVVVVAPPVVVVAPPVVVVAEPAQTLLRLNNLGVDPLKVAEDPAVTRSPIVWPAGTATKTLSCWVPLGMIWEPENVTVSVPRFKVMVTKAVEPLLGANTKCQ